MNSRAARCGAGRRRRLPCFPVLVRSAVMVSAPAVETLLADRCRFDSANVVQDKQCPNGYCGVFATSRYLEV
jgi:hypothetical protein